jgi:flavin-dependent dehydrogenase
MTHYDVAIAGTGPAGCSAAITLARTGARVIALGRPPPGIPRGETLPPEIGAPLRVLGLREQFLATDPLPSPGLVKLWGTSLPHHNDFAFHPDGNGWHVDRERFDSALVAACVQQGVEVLPVGRLVAERADRRGWRFDPAPGDAQLASFTADFAIDATGRAAWLARRLGVRRIVHDHLFGVTAVLRSTKTDAVLDRRALIEACPSGWWYSAKIDTDRYAAAFMTDAGQLSRRRAALWSAAMCSAPFSRARFQLMGVAPAAVRITAASTSRLWQLVGPDWAVIGDAAATVDPLSGRGVLHAMCDGVTVGATLAGTNRRAALARYAAEKSAQSDSDRISQAELYRRETRWADRTFWASRQTAKTIRTSR